MFYNSVGFNTAEIVLDTFGKNISIFYHLNDNPVQHIWQNIHRDSDRFVMGIVHGQDRKSLIDRLNILLENNNIPTIDNSVSQDTLNDLHNYMVNGTFNPDDELPINLLIHAIESKSNLLAEFDASTVFYRDSFFDSIPVIEEHKLWLVTDNKWGHLLLGYGTLGKAWDEIAETNDDIDDLKIQSTISSETCMVFNVDYPHLKTTEKILYKWAKNSIYDVPLDNLNKLSLGRYLLGEVIITDVFLDHNPNVSDWYVPNHKCKLSWNREVLGYDAVVKEVRFFDSDMYYDTVLKHARFEDICTL